MLPATEDVCVGAHCCVVFVASPILMLSRKYKLSRTSFPHHLEQRFLWAGKVLRVQAYKKSASGGNPRFAVVVSKRLSDSAVMRNTFKRQMMVIVGQQLPRFSSLPYSKYIITPRAHLRVVVREDMSNDVETFFVANESRIQH